MSFHADIKLGVKINNVDYDINVAIPNSAPTNDEPYTFSVTGSADKSGADTNDGDKSSRDQKSGNKGDSDNSLLTVVVGDKGNYFVSVAPPKDILDATDGTVSDLAVSVNEGDYDVKTGKFAGKDADKDGSADKSADSAAPDSTTSEPAASPESNNPDDKSTGDKSPEPASNSSNANDGAAS